jgi:hypothetical protein
MLLPQAIGFGLPRRRANCSNWDDPKEFLLYVVTDIVAEDWEVRFPNGRIIDDFMDASQYAWKSFPTLSCVQGSLDGDSSGSSGPT